jgi:diacylglycerol kinase family enzyme
MNALLILNDGAGSVNGEKDAVTSDAVLGAFSRAGISVAARVAPPKRLCETLQAAADERPDALFVGGGDGTISAAAGCLVDTNIALGVLPLGTFNHFARDLGLPVPWQDALAALAQARPRAVDVGEVNGRIFINNCSLGSYPDAVRERDALRRAHGAAKWLAMLLATIKVFRRLRRLRLRIETPQDTLALRTPFMFVGNNAYSGHVLEHSLRPRLDEGRLWIYTTRAHRRLTLLRLAWQSFIHRIDAADALESHSVSEATVTSASGRAIPIAADGELLDLQPPLRFRIRPRALRVLAPAGEAKP